jgi:hypothetical protein
MTEFNKQGIYGYYLIDWTPVEKVRLNDSPSHNAMFEWCQKNCKSRFHWTFIYGHNRPEDEQPVDAVTWEFESSQDADLFRNTWDK